MLIRSYRFGSVKRNPSHRVKLVEGNYLDHRTDLDEGAIGKPAAPANKRPVISGPHEPVSTARLSGFCRKVLATLRRNAVDGQKHHALRDAARALGGVQADAGFSDDEAIGWLLHCLPDTDTVEDWNLAGNTAAWGLARGRECPIYLENRERMNGTGRINGHVPPPAEGPDYCSDRRQA